jgi:hypothetical protein
VAGQAQPAGHAAALVCPTGPDPPAAGRHPAARRPDPRTRPAGAAAGAGCWRTPWSSCPRWPPTPWGSPGGRCWSAGRRAA